MELIARTNFDFMRVRHAASAASLALVIFSFVVWFSTGSEKYGVDFVGGTEVVVKFETPTEIGEVREALDDAGLAGAVVQAFGEGESEFSIRVKSDFAAAVEEESEEPAEAAEGAGQAEEAAGEESSAVEDAEEGGGAAAAARARDGERIKDVLETMEGKKFTLLKQDYVGPIIGEQIRKDGMIALILAIAGILAYVAFRFEWRFAVGAIAALAHDVIVTAGIFVFSGKEISAVVLAALLTIIGFSINDTIVIFDRMRENLLNWYKKEKGKKRSGDTHTLKELINVSVNETLSRTILTSLTVLFVVLALWLFGGSALEELAYALLIGVIAGVYSTVFVACAIVYALAPDSTAEFVEKTVKPAAAA